MQITCSICHVSREKSHYSRRQLAKGVDEPKSCLECWHGRAQRKQQPAPAPAAVAVAAPEPAPVVLAVAPTAACCLCHAVKPRDGFSRTEWQRARRGNRARCRACVAAYDVKRHYGLDKDAHDKMWEEQKGACSICKKKFAERSDGCVDHDHSKEKGKAVRSLLCNRCNVVIGAVEEDPKILAAMIEYLKEHKAGV